MKKIEVAVILGAGFGKRLTPITNEIPKPLVEIGNETILEKTIKLVKKLNLKKILINTHYKRDQLKNYIEKKGNALWESLLITSIWKYKITQQ